ncbi:MAG TPA: L-2-hydroxyglutarate oxidase [Bryobacteraceae bacterium]|nr:L-2-hydroxyglutarate oxidase [Bryobacteraceae bacterium]
MKTIGIVGGGIIGLATAYRFGQRMPGRRVVVFEKEDTVGRHQTGHNSGVLHAGLYYKPGSNKARLAVEGIRQMVRFCAEHGVKHEICGKLVVAASQEEAPRMMDLYERGTANGLSGLRVMGREEMREIEPHVGGVQALRVPEEGIVDYAGVCAALVAGIRAQGGEVRTSARVTKLRETGTGWVVESSAGDSEVDFLVNCAGLHCDRVAELGGVPREMRIVPFRGEYYLLRADRQHLVRHLIYPVPDPSFPFLGVHFTRLIHGGVEAGPNAVLAFAREGYTKRDFVAADLWDALTFPGLWKFLRRYPSVSWYEIRRSFSRALFCESLQRLVPEVRPEDIEPGGAGVRAQSMLPNGDLVQDFLFADRPRALHLLNAPSPGATASLAIGEEVAARVERFA